MDLFGFICIAICHIHFSCFYELGVPYEHVYGALPTSGKHAPGILEHVSYCVVDVCYLQLVCPVHVPVALCRPQEKHAPGLLEYVPCVLY